MSQFRKKPVVIEAMQLRWDTWSEMCEFLGPAFFDAGGRGVRDPAEAIGLDIPTLEGTMHASAGDWIIRGVKGELYPCRDDIFEATYEPAGLPTEALEALGPGGLAALVRRLADELENIVRIDLRRLRADFGAGADGEFREWAQNRARAALASVPESLRTPAPEGTEEES